MSARSFHLPRRSPLARGGFTLVEMMISLAVFLLLAAAVFAFLTGVLQGASMLQDNGNRADRIVALHSYLEHKLTQMPARSTITSYQRGDGEGLIQNGIIFGNTNFATAIDAKSQSDGLYVLRLTTFATDADATQPQDAREVLNQMVTTDDVALNWVPLIKDVKTLTWRFQDASLGQWDTVWLNSTTPNLVELSIQDAGQQNPTVMDYWVPTIQPIHVHIQGNGGGTSKQSGTKTGGGTNTTGGGGNTPRLFH